MELLARLPQTDLARLSAGVPAHGHAGRLGQTYQGTVWQVSPIIDPQTRQGVARIAVPYNRELRPGGFAAAEIRAGSTSAPLLPESAVLSDDARQFRLYRRRRTTRSCGATSGSARSATAASRSSRA